MEKSSAPGALPPSKSLTTSISLLHQKAKPTSQPSHQKILENSAHLDEGDGLHFEYKDSYKTGEYNPQYFPDLKSQPH